MARGWLATFYLEHWRIVSLSPGAQSRTATKVPIYRHGYSQHGNYFFGWKDDSLQRAMDNRCDGNVCSVLKTQSDEEAMNCTKSRTVKEDFDGCKSHLLAIIIQAWSG